MSQRASNAYATTDRASNPQATDRASNPHVTDLVNIILITAGTHGEKLLFRYPFRNGKDDASSSHSLTPTDETARSISEDSKNCQNGDGHQGDPESASNPYKIMDGKVEYMLENEVVIDNKLFGYDDTLLAGTLSPKNTLCNQNFEIKIGSRRFVGYPVRMREDDFYASNVGQTNKDKEDVTIIMVHVVLAFKSGVIDPKIILNYHTISKMLGMALRHEENRERYLSKQREIMIRERDIGLADDNPYFMESILAKSALAQDLVNVFHSITESGVMKIQINGWISLNFSLPHKVHKNASQKVIVDAYNFNNYIKRIKPYHTFLLFGNKEKEHLIQSVPIDASPALVRLIKMYNPMKSFQALSQDTDISLPQIFQIVAHLVYWGKCNVIYPLAESNVYVITEYAHTQIDSKYAVGLVREFPKKSLHKILSRFSFPITLGEFRDPLSSKDEQQEQVQIVTWLLKRRLLKQLHTYVYFMPPEPSSNQNGFQHSLSNDSTVDELSFQDQLSRFKAGPIEKKIFSELSWEEQRSLMEMSKHPAIEDKDIILFLQMCKYFRGQHHLEEIMYYENRRRSDLNTLIDKFRNLLITVQHEDLATSQWL